MGFFPADPMKVKSRTDLAFSLTKLHINKNAKREHIQGQKGSEVGANFRLRVALGNRIGPELG